jgi:hypothetical protein
MGLDVLTELNREVVGLINEKIRNQERLKMRQFNCDDIVWFEDKNDVTRCICIDTLNEKTVSGHELDANGKTLKPFKNWRVAPSFLRKEK